MSWGICKSRTYKKFANLELDYRLHTKMVTSVEVKSFHFSLVYW